jgi:hypothetical protein
MVSIGFEAGNFLTQWLMDFFYKVLLAAAAEITAAFSSSSDLNHSVLSSGGQTCGNYIVTCMGDGLSFVKFTFLFLFLAVFIYGFHCMNCSVS